ncbi:MAG: nucleotidyltransferase domain-containing protein [Mariprofundaceae bacterium]|nr:nucleotidyltransferase domain-containing protein [Mariprofundaceae bacterium]
MQMDVLELTHRQSLEFTDSQQLFAAWQDAQARVKHYSGSMHWKTIKGKKYLYHMLDGYGKGKSLGVKRDDTQAMYEAFQKGKQETIERLKSIQKALDEKAALNRAVGLNRVPLIVARIARELDKQGLMGERICMVGTHAIYAYEALAGVMVYRELLATADADFLWDNRETVKFSSDADVDGFLPMLKKADRSFERSEQHYRAINKDGFMVDLIVAEPKDLRAQPQEQMGDAYDLKASGIGSLRWLINSPKVEAVVIDSKGYPFRIAVPDPRSFAIHKLWVSKQPNRRADKARRDKQQALTVAKLLMERLPQFPFTAKELKMFPKALVEQSLKELE